MKTIWPRKGMVPAAYLVLSAIIVLFTILPAHAETLSGVVLDGAGRPIPGLTVSLVHPQIGRSAPSVTDSAGRFIFSTVPLVPDDYYLEIYWGKELVYRKALPVHGNVELGQITLK